MNRGEIGREYSFSHLFAHLSQISCCASCQNGSRAIMQWDSHSRQSVI